MLPLNTGFLKLDIPVLHKIHWNNVQLFWTFQGSPCLYHAHAFHDKLKLSKEIAFLICIHCSL